MNHSEYIKSLENEQMPEGLSVYLQSLWLDKKGEWDRAHGLIDSLPGEDAARLHAYLHRKEGDLSNAGYWYSRVGTDRPDSSLDEEWDELLRYFLGKDGS
ncbi:hypothetical protein SAMN04488057_11962 [Cyclobacterium lianum]|uniref:Tetratricopeptide repeat-containing protein n=1 Tax=Cyclobacterium lianum TaxID=388280 RepID=A0A1M7QKE1_9BACT|nr:hypothetical protein [Cyclobacterium lianum]SHN31702.1 hypothetical protein SAMN04488057_11962 [Cyclobacterium lianum]